MAFEFFEEEGRGFEPKATIRKQGQIGLNQGVLKRFDIKGDQPVLLGYDRETKVVAIRLLDEPRKGSKRAVIRSNNCSIAAKSFFDYFDIPYREQTVHFTIEKNEDKNMITFCIAEKGENSCS
jgi:hypothetical protein